MTLSLTFKGNLHGFLSESAEIYSIQALPLLINTFYNPEDHFKGKSMKSLLVIVVISFANFSYAFDFKAEVEKLAKDKKNHEKAKELVKKGFDYLNKNKKESKAKK